MRQQVDSGTVGPLGSVRHAFAADVQLWLVDLDAYADAVPLDGLDAEERARAARVSPSRDARRFLAGRHALRRVLARALDRSPDALVLAPDELGKPRLAADELAFSLSHSGNTALIGLSRAGGIGVDVEVVQPVVDADAIAATHFSETEQAEWSRAPASRRDRTFLACWTRKEACLKALGVGLSLPPATVEVGGDSDPRVVTVRLGAQPCEVTLQSLDLPNKVVGAAALVASRDVGLARRLFGRA